MNVLLIFGLCVFPLSAIITDERAYDGGIVRLHIYRIDSPNGECICNTMFRLNPLGEPIISMKRTIEKVMRNAYSIEAYRNSTV